MTRTRYSGLWITIMVFVSTPALADSDAESRMAELQKQVEMLSKELQAIQQQLAQSKETQIQERDKSQGTPVLAAFKDGVVFEDGTGNWKLAINGRVQADYRQFSPEVDAADTFSLRRARLPVTSRTSSRFLRIRRENLGSAMYISQPRAQPEPCMIGKGRRARVRRIALSIFLLNE